MVMGRRVVPTCILAENSLAKRFTESFVLTYALLALTKVCQGSAHSQRQVEGVECLKSVVS
jgi:hypothetical protein